jgi:hypothetical protein
MAVRCQLLKMEEIDARRGISKLKEDIEESSQMLALGFDVDVDTGKIYRKDGWLKTKMESSPAFMEKERPRCGVRKQRHTIFQIHS